MGVRPDPMPADMAVNRVMLTKAALVSPRTLTLVLTGKDKLVEKALKDGAFSLHPIGGCWPTWKSISIFTSAL